MFIFVVINRFPVNVSFFLSFLHFKHLVLVLLLIFFKLLSFFPAMPESVARWRQSSTNQRLILCFGLKPPVSHQ